MSGETHIINRRAIVSGVHAGRTTKEISKFNNIPISTVKKFKKDYKDFIDAGNIPEDYDSTRKLHKPWMDGVAAGRPYIWQQDGAPAHNSNRTQDWYSVNFPYFLEKEGLAS